MQVTVVVPWEDSCLAVIYLNDFIGDLPYDGAIMGNEANGPSVIAEGICENLP